MGQMQKIKTIHVGLCGYRGIGKSVFFTMLFDVLRQDPDMQLFANPIDRDALCQDYATLLNGQFLPATQSDKVFRFEAVYQKKIEFVFESLDYPGEDVDISHLNTDMVAFFKKCDAILFMIDPGSATNPQKIRKQLGTFSYLMREVVQTEPPKHPVVGLITLKSDILEGFDNNHVTLIDSSWKKRIHQYTDIRSFIDQRYHADPTWHDTLVKICDEMKEFFETALTYRLDFQVFFVSSLGGVEKKTVREKDIVSEIEIPGKATPSGRQLRPIGVKDAIYWGMQKIFTRLYHRKLRWIGLIFGILVILTAIVWKIW